MLKNSADKELTKEAFLQKLGIKKWILFLVGMVLIGLILSEYQALSPSPSPPAPAPPAPTSPPAPSTWAEVIETVMPAVVMITTKDGFGSGVIIDKRGYVLTNNHVVDKVESVTVTLVTQERYQGKVIGRHETKDLAIVKIVSGYLNLQAARLGNSAAVRIGDEVAAVGYPHADIHILRGSPTVSKGIVSAIRKHSETDETCIQIDAPINPGNSGGPLINLKGEVVGVVTYILKVRGTRVEGVNFAIAINDAIPFIIKVKGEIAVLFEDDFSNPASGWPMISRKEYAGNYKDGEYHLLVKKTDYAAWVWNLKAGQFTDFTLEADATLISGPKESLYGIVFRLQDSENFYRFLVSGDGYYLVGTRFNGNWTLLQSRTKSAFIKKDNSTNHLKVVCKGSQIKVYVNGYHLTTVTDNSFATGYVGLIVDSPKLSTRVHFDNIRVYSLLSISQPN